MSRFYHQLSGLDEFLSSVSVFTFQDFPFRKRVIHLGRVLFTASVTFHCSTLLHHLSISLTAVLFLVQN